MRILMTGASGYLARVTLPYLLDDDEISSVAGFDVRHPEIDHPKFTFIQGDVRSDQMDSAVRKADLVAHLAFIVTEIKDKRKTFDINVNGTRRVLEAVEAAGVRRLVVASSICAYGARPRTEAITEETPLLGNRNSYYSHTKRIVEGLLDRFENENPATVVTRLRPSIITGKHTDNFFIDLIGQRIILYPNSNKTGLPLVHEDDAGRAFYLAIKKNVPGAFNIAAGSLPFRRLGELIRKPVVGVPNALLKPVMDIGFALGLSPVSSHWLVLGKYPFKVSCLKANMLLGWEARYSPEEAFMEMVSAWKKK